MFKYCKFITKIMFSMMDNYNFVQLKVELDIELIEKLLKIHEFEVV